MAMTFEQFAIAYRAALQAFLDYQPTSVISHQREATAIRSYALAHAIHLASQCDELAQAYPLWAECVEAELIKDLSPRFRRLLTSPPST